jgi:hypothetical protein
MADTTIGVRLQADDGVSPKVKDIKKELKLAQQEVVLLSEKFGATSKQAAEAAKKAAELKDQIGDAKSLVDAFNPDTKFRAFGAAINTVVGGFTALTGSMALLGVESEQVQKTLLKVQSALALSQGISQLQEGIQSIKNLGSVITNTLGRSGLIGIAIAGVAALAAEVFGLFDGVAKKQKLLNEIGEETEKIYAKEKATLDLLVDEINNENTSRQRKQEIVDELQATYPNYFQNLKLEGDNVVGLTEGYLKLSKAIELKARAQAAENVYIKQQQAFIEQFGNKTVEELEANIDNLPRFMRASARKAINELKDAQKEIIGIVAQSNSELEKLGGDPTAKSKIKTSTGSKKTPKEEYKSQRDGIVEVTNALGEQERTLIRVAGLKEAMNTTLAGSDNAYTLNYLKNKAEERRATEEAILIEEYAAHRKQQLAGAVGQALGALADLVGKQTAAGKVLAIAEATINTYLAASNILKNTARNPVTGAIPGFAIAQMIATIAAGLITVRNIIKTPVPGTSASGGAVPTSAPIAPQTPQSTRTRLDADQLNQIGNAAVRAFVIESDVSTNQERIRRINRQARL